MPQPRPQRMSFTNLYTGQTVEAISNPPEMLEQLAANWEEPGILGLSHKPQHYSNTENHSFEFTLQCDALQDGQNRSEDVSRFRRFILSLFYAPRGEQSIIGGSPSRFLFLWPNFIALSCVIKSAKIRSTRFDRNGRPTVHIIDVKISEIRDVRLTSEEVLAEGTLRASGT